MKNSNYKKLCRKLPSKKEISEINIGRLSKKDSQIIWESFIKEIQILNDEEYKYVNRSILLNDNFHHVVDISISGNVGVSNFSSSYLISNYTPKTASLYFSMVNNKFKNNLKSETQKIINFNSEKPEYFNYQITINAYDNNTKHYNTTSFYGNSNIENDPYQASIENSKEIFSIIGKSEYQNAEISKSYICINMHSKKNNLSYFLALSEEDISKIIDIYNKNIEK